MNALFFSIKVMAKQTNKQKQQQPKTNKQTNKQQQQQKNAGKNRGSGQFSAHMPLTSNKRKANYVTRKRFPLPPPPVKFRHGYDCRWCLAGIVCRSAGITGLSIDVWAGMEPDARAGIWISWMRILFALINFLQNF